MSLSTVKKNVDNKIVIRMQLKITIAVSDSNVDKQPMNLSVGHNDFFYFKFSTTKKINMSVPLLIKKRKSEFHDNTSLRMFFFNESKICAEF